MKEVLKKVADCLKYISTAIKKLCAEEVRKVLAEMSKRDKTAELKSLLEKYGASTLSGVKPKYYADLLKEAENA